MPMFNQGAPVTVFVEFSLRPMLRTKLVHLAGRAGRVESPQQEASNHRRARTGEGGELALGDILVATRKGI